MDDSTDVTPSEGNEDAVQKPDEGSNPATDGENNEGDDDSNQDGSDDQNKPDDDTTTPGDDSSDDSSDGKDTGNEEQEAPDDEQVKDPNAKDETEGDDDETTIKKNDKDLMAVKSARGEYGTLVNGDFEQDIADEWTLTEGYNHQTDEWMTNNTTKYLSYWVKGETKEISVSQTILNVKPGIYTVSAFAGGTYAKDSFELKLKIPLLC